MSVVTNNQNYKIDIPATVLLALAAIASAWSGYQSARWGGVQAFSLTRSNALGTKATGQAVRADQLLILDAGLFVEYVTAEERGDQKMADFIAARFRPEMKNAFKAWIATDPMHNPRAPSSPFVMPQYSPAARENSMRFAALSEKEVRKASIANQQSDDYVLLTVIFATVLFFAGVSTHIQRWKVSLSTLIVGLAFFFYGLVVLVSYPVH